MSVMSVSPTIGTGILYHSHSQGIASFTVQSDEEKPDKFTKFCYGNDHLVVLKTSTIQSISSNDSFSATYPFLQQLNRQCPFIDIAFGSKHGLALDSQHRVFSFGDNTYGQLGVGSVGTKQDTESVIESAKPLFIEYFEKVNQSIIQIACGSNHCVALSRSGDVYSWGDGRCGQLGSNVLSLQILPQCIPHLPVIGYIACGPQNGAAVSKTGSLYQWGDRQAIPSALKVMDSMTECEDVEDIENVENLENLQNVDHENQSRNVKELKVRKVAMGMAHSLCLTECGRLFGWGLSSNGQLGSINNKKTITTPTAITDFEGASISNIECFGQCSIVHIEGKGLYVMGFNDKLFDGIVHREPFQIQLSPQRVEQFGCSRNDFVILTATSIASVSPSVANVAGTELVIRGHGVYRTAHPPTVRFVIKCDDDEHGEVMLIEKAHFVESEQNEENNENDGNLRLVVTTPNLSAYPLTFPVTVQMAIAPDGCHFSEAQDLWIINDPDVGGDDDQKFVISPQCGDEQGNVKCLISSSTEYISSIVSKVELDDMKIRFVPITKDEEIEYTVTGEINEGQIECTTPPMTRGLYGVEVAVDGQRFIDIQCTFRSYKVECTQCVPDILNLSQTDNDESADDDDGNIGLVALELKVTGYVPVDASKVGLKLVSESDETCFLTAECVYESQSKRDIDSAEMESKNQFESKRAECRKKEKEELDVLKEGYKEEDEAHEQRIGKLEKDKKKKKKAADIEAWEAEMKQV